jgi:hypothetical protein
MGLLYRGARLISPFNGDYEKMSVEDSVKSLGRDEVRARAFATHLAPLRFKNPLNHSDARARGFVFIYLICTSK